jgi:hypothetical protein
MHSQLPENERKPNLADAGFEYPISTTEIIAKTLTGQRIFAKARWKDETVKVSSFFAYLRQKRRDIWGRGCVISESQNRRQNAGCALAAVRGFGRRPINFTAQPQPAPSIQA